MHISRNAHSDDHPACSLKYPKTHLNECTNTFCQRESESGTIATLFSLHKAATGKVHRGHLIQAALETLSACVLILYMCALSECTISCGWLIMQSNWCTGSKWKAWHDVVYLNTEVCDRRLESVSNSVRLYKALAYLLWTFHPFHARRVTFAGLFSYQVILGACNYSLFG